MTDNALRLPALALLGFVLSACDSGSSRGVEEIFRPSTVSDEGLVNASESVIDVLEGGSLRGACEAWEADPEDRRKKLLCGKEIYFHESFDTLGVPASVVDFLLENFPEEMGPGFSGVGLVPDPTSDANLPLGMTPSRGIGTGEAVPAYAFTCASCHFSRLPDGRYAAGAANHDYDYGLHILAMTVFPRVLMGEPEDQHAPEAVARIRPLLDRAAEDPTIRLRFLAAFGPEIPFLTEFLPAMTQADERAYASWETGTMDFLIPPIPVNDRVHTISKISPLWGLPNAVEIEDAGMAHAMLAWTGGTVSLERFFEGFVLFGQGDVGAWPRERFEPALEYVYSLHAPAPPPPGDSAAVERGASLFESRDCASCHDGARASGRRIYEYEEIGTDAAMRRWLDPDLDGEPCCGIELAPDEPLTHGIKSPRLVGLWTMRRFLHNGSVDSLEDLFCLDGPRGTVTEEPFGDGGHDFTCRGLEDGEKRDLIAFLRAH